MYAIISFLILLTLIGAESSELISCLPTKLVGSGFLTKFYDYELSSKAGWEPGFFKSGYRTNVFGTKKGIHNIDFEHEGPWDIRSVYEFIYGQRTKYTNFVTEYTGYFFAKESGKYTFSLTANSGASLQLGSNGICCDDVLCSVTEDSSYALTTSKDGSRVSSKFVSFDLKKNLYYPMKLVYFNSQGDSSLSLRMKNPHGNVISDFSDYVWQVTFKGSICYTTVYGLWSGSSKTISTHKVANTKHHTETVHVLDPKPRGTATLTWDQPSTSTKIEDNGPTVMVVVYVPRLRTTIHEYWNGETKETDSFIGKDQVATIRIKHPRKRVHAFVTEDRPSTSTEFIEDGETLRIIEHRPRETVTVEEFWNGETNETDSFIGDNQIATIRIKHPRKRVHLFVTEDIPSTSIELIEDGETLRIIEHRPRTIPPSDESLQDIQNTTETSAEADQMASDAVRNSRGHAVASGMEDMINSSSVETGVTNSVVEHELSQPVNATEFLDGENNHTEVPTGGDQVVALRPEIKELEGKANSFEVDLSDRANAALSPLYGLVSKQMTDFPSETFENSSGTLERTSSSTKLENELEKSAGITKAWSNSVEDQIYDGSLLSANVTTSTSASKKTDTDKFSVNGMSLNETERGLCFLTIFKAQSSQACGTPFCECDGSLTLPYTQVPIETDAHSNDSLKLACNSESLDRDKANLTRSEKSFRSSTALDKSGISSGDDARFVHLANSVVYSMSAMSNSHSKTRQEYSDLVEMSLCPLSCPSLPQVSSGESATARITSLLSEPGTEISPVNYSPLSVNLPDLMNAVNAGIVTESVNRTQPGNCKVPHCTSQYGVTSVGVEYDSGVERSPLDENLDSYATVICTDHCTSNMASSRLSNQSSDEQTLDFSPVSPVFDRSISGFITFEKASSSLKLPTTTLKSSSQVVLFEGAACKMSLKMFTVAISLLLWLL
ncbi:hypothetical protein OXX69_005307 [Metschnikowia pulcherrima]